MTGDTILILDFGGTSAQLLAKRLRRAQVYSEILPADTAASEISALAPKGIILCGSNKSGSVTEAPFCDKDVWSLGIPVLAIDHGARSMLTSLGGKLNQTFIEEQTLQLHFVSSCPLFDSMSYADRRITRMDQVELPAGFTVAAHGHGVAAAFADVKRNLYGMQFGIEANDPEGIEILNNFMFGICGCEKWWTTETFAARIIDDIRSTLGSSHVMIALSGGVDSSVCAALMHKAVGDNVHCIYIDTGLMRKGDTRIVRELIGEQMGIPIKCINARDRFLDRLQGITSPEGKWEAITDEFQKIYAEQAQALGNIEYIAKGTIYSDILNFEEQEQELHSLMGYKLIEPIRTLFKSEVRELAELLGMSEMIAYRQSLPGAGLAIRMSGEVTREKVEILREADAILREAAFDAGIDVKLYRCFAFLAETASTGTKPCKYVVALRALTNTKACYRLPYELLENVSEKIITDIPQVDRVVLDMSPFPMRAIEWE